MLTEKKWSQQLRIRLCDEQLSYRLCDEQLSDYPCYEQLVLLCDVVRNQIGQGPKDIVVD